MEPNSQPAESQPQTRNDANETTRMVTTWSDQSWLSTAQRPDGAYESVYFSNARDRREWRQDAVITANPADAAHNHEVLRDIINNINARQPPWRRASEDRTPKPAERRAPADGVRWADSAPTAPWSPPAEGGRPEHPRSRELRRTSSDVPAAGNDVPASAGGGFSWTGVPGDVNQQVEGLLAGVDRLREYDAAVADDIHPGSGDHHREEADRREAKAAELLTPYGYASVDEYAAVVDAGPERVNSPGPVSGTSATYEAVRRHPPAPTPAPTASAPAEVGPRR